MIKCLVLDGFHKGHRVDMPTPLQQLVLLKPKAITIDDCCDGDVVGVDNDIKKTYILAGYSVDRSIALYSTDGSMDSIFNRDWIVPSDKYQPEQPIYMGIHDPRAVIDNLTVTDMTTERPDGTQGNLESPKTPAEALRQHLAAIEHERWSDWQAWCHKILSNRKLPQPRA
jgi:hypothetical protein